MKERFLKFFPLVKVDEANRIVYGLVTAEQEDRDGETCHYASTKPEYQKVNEEIGKASGGENIMPLREMHQLNAIGAGKTIVFDDASKQIRMGFKVVDDSAWKKVTEKVLLGFSQGGRYLKRWTDSGTTYYTAQPGEVSLVDNPCLPGALIEYAKADGTIEMFKTPSAFSEADVDRIVRRLLEGLEKGVKYLVAPDHLPYTDANGKPNHRLMGAAWAALHGGYRGNKYEGPDKQKAIARLKEIYHSEGMEPPSEKAFTLIAEISPRVEDPDSLWDLYDEEQGSDLDTHLEKFSRILGKLKEHTETGAEQMKPEQIKKAAEALGLTEEEFKKQMLAFVESDELLTKGKKGLAAAMHHLKKAMDHHAKMHKHHDGMAEMHKTLGEMHKAHADHLDNLHKAMSACVDDGEADKILKAAAAVEPKKEETKPETLSKADLDSAVAEAVKKALEALPEPRKGSLFAVERGSEEKKEVSRDPIPV